MDNEDEVWLRECEAWFTDARALCKKFGGLYLRGLEGGEMVMGIPGRGEVPVVALLKSEGKPSLEVVK